MEAQYEEAYAMKFHKFMIFVALPLRILLEGYLLFSMFTLVDQYSVSAVIIAAAVESLVILMDLCSEVFLCRLKWLGVKLFKISLSVQIVTNLVFLMMLVRPGANTLFNLLYFIAIMLVGLWLYAFSKYYALRSEMFQ